ncbi:MAG: hypothetical protein ABR523_09010 [Desulfurivibrionaceae bacterium]
MAAAPVLFIAGKNSLLGHFSVLVLGAVMAESSFFQDDAVVSKFRLAFALAGMIYTHRA